MFNRTATYRFTLLLGLLGTMVFAFQPAKGRAAESKNSWPTPAYRLHLQSPNELNGTIGYATWEDVERMKEIVRLAFPHMKEWETPYMGMVDNVGTKKLAPLVARDPSGKVVGFLSYKDDSHLNPGTLTLCVLAIDPQSQRQGYATAILKNAIKIAKANKKIKSISLEEESWNKNAHKLYGKLGFRESKTDEQPNYPSGAGIFMRKRIAQNQRSSARSSLR